MNFFAVCYKNTSHIDASCCFLTGIFFFFFSRACQGCRAPAPRRGRARLMESLSWGSVPCAACCKRMARVCWPCSLLHGMQPTAWHAPCCTACICAQPVSMQRPGDLQTQTTSLSAGMSPGANEIFMSQGIQGLGCKERQSFSREDELEGNILLESTLLESIACRRGWRMILLPWSEAPAPSWKVKCFLTCPHGAVLRSS